MASVLEVPSSRTQRHRKQGGDADSWSKKLQIYRPRQQVVSLVLATLPLNTFYCGLPAAANSEDRGVNVHLSQHFYLTLKI
jgi:hypothetical protein